MSEVKRYVLRGPADCPAPDGSQIERLLPGWQVVDAAAYDALQARVKQVVEEGRAISRLNVQQAVEIGGLQARVRELDEVVKHYATCDAHRQQEWQADLDRLHQAEQERDQARADTQSLRDLVGQWIWAMYLTPESYECRTIETYRQAVEARVRQLEELVQAELPPPLRRLEQQELLRLRARVGELEEALRHIAEARWSPRTTASYDEDARYAYPERESYVRQYAQRALAGKEEHGSDR